MASLRTRVIFNPASGRGRGGRRMAGYRDLVQRALPYAEFVVSEYPGHEYALADQALDEGVELLVAVGGDGTWSHVADRIVASGREDAVLGLLPSGTGNDFGRNLGLAYGDPEDAVRKLVHGTPREVDVGRVVTPSLPADPEAAGVEFMRTRHFINVVGVGFDVAVVEAARGARLLKGELLYKVTALQQLVRFPGLPLAVEREGEELQMRNHLMVTVTSGAFFGGGFPITPAARVDDGRLHACIIEDATALRRVALFSRAGSGRHVSQPEVQLLQERRFHLRFGGPVRFEIDGDLFRTPDHELEMEILPGALRVLAA